MLISIEYKIITPVLIYEMPDKMIIISHRPISRKRPYILTKNPLKDKFAVSPSFFLILYSPPTLIKKEIVFPVYKNPAYHLLYISTDKKLPSFKNFPSTNKKLQSTDKKSTSTDKNCFSTNSYPNIKNFPSINDSSKFFNVDFYTTTYLNKFTINDYFIIRHIPYTSDIPSTHIIPLPSKKNRFKFDLDMDINFTPSTKHTLFLLNTYPTFCSPLPRIKKCVFNISRISGYEELFLYLRERHDLLEIEEDSEVVCIVDDTVYYVGDNIQLL